eukprot:Lankesteria_metandrocarpae@DN5304_c1_g1_i1.p1
MSRSSSALPMFVHPARLCPSSAIFPVRSGGVKGLLRRMFKFRQLIDIQSTSTQFIDLIVAPRKEYRMVEFRKQTKGYHARDDPGLVLLLLFFLLIYGIAMSTAFRVSRSKFLFGALFYCIVFLVSGITIATFTYTLARSLYVGVTFFRSGNKFKDMDPRAYRHSVDRRFPAASTVSSQDAVITGISNRDADSMQQPPDSRSAAGMVEWMYCFDIHCNACVPFFTASCLLQFLFLPVLIQPSLAPCILSNGVWCLGSCSYVYITSLGFARLPYLRNTEKFMYPVPLVMFSLLVLTLMGVNMSRTTVNIFLKLFS